VGGLRERLPRSFQGRLTVTVSALVAAILVAVSLIVLNRMDTYFHEQEERALADRALLIGQVTVFLGQVIAQPGAVLLPGDVVDGDVAAGLSSDNWLESIANTMARADVVIEIGGITRTSTGTVYLTPAANGVYRQALTAEPGAREARDVLTQSIVLPVPHKPLIEDWGVRVTLSNPLTTRAYTVRTITGLLVMTGLGALLAAILLAALVTDRFTRPLRRLAESARRFGGGDLGHRVPPSVIGASYTEVQELSGQFNQMASRLEESVALVRRDRDRSRDFLADVSHELRTPIAAMRTFNELLRDGAWRDDATREEFLESNRTQLERLDWLAQNLLELSKLESGLLALDLRPEDLRVTVESAVEQAEPLAARRSIELTLQAPAEPVKVRHDPQRVGQVVSNLIGNAIKFTPRGGRVSVEVRAHRDGAQVEVRDTGVGIDAAELPRIFDRFYRGSSANEARGSGSGLGLAIVKSILDMHGARISVESRVGSGSSFTVTLLRDPRPGGSSAAGEPASTPDPAAMPSPIPTEGEADVAISS
jgi:signal transduction histidine kinase